MANLVKFMIGIILSCLMGWGLYDLLVDIEANKCEMTYMFEYPEYIPIQVNQVSIGNALNYRLYVYGEGVYAQQLKKKKLKGIPVLFIPGNGGSYKQVRSLGSVTYRKAAEENSPFHFNFFAVDFHEDLGAFFGPALEDQTRFVSAAIRTIIALYKKPPKVILVGHSLGGFVARAAVTLADIPASDIPLIITQATPHLRPVIVNDHTIAAFYKNVNMYWTVERMFDLRDTVLVSIGGGSSDYQVPDFITTSTLADVDTSMQAVPGCWLSTDHQAVVWCKQLVLATARALFDSIDPTTKSIHTDRQHVVNAFRYHLLERNAGKNSFPLTHPSKLLLNGKAHWSEIIKRQYHYDAKKLAKEIYLMFPIHYNHSEYEHLTIISKDTKEINWVFACKANLIQSSVRMCATGENLSHGGRIIPMDQKEINIDLQPLKNEDVSHVVVWLYPNGEDVSIDVDVSNKASHNFGISVPAFNSIGTVVITERTPIKSLALNVSLKGINQIWQSYVLSIDPLNDECSQPSPSRTPIVSLSSEWNPRSEYISHKISDSGYNYIVELSVGSPARNENDTMDVHVVLNPKCVYSMSLSVNYRGVFRRLCLVYGVQVPAFLASHFLLVLATQCKSLALEQTSSNPLMLILTMSPIVVVPFLKLLVIPFSYIDVYTDIQLLSDYGIELGVLQFILFLSTLVISLVLVALVWVSIFVWGRGAYAYTKKFITRYIGMSSMLPLTEIGLTRLPLLFAGLLLSIALGTCGSVGLVLASGIYFVKIFKDYEDYVQSLVISAVTQRKNTNTLSSIHFHLTLLMLSLIVSALNLPPLIMWFKNLQFQSKLPHDPSLAICLVTLVALGFLWQRDINPNRKFYKELGFGVHAAAILVILFGCVNLYRVSYIISAVLLLVGLHQLLAPICEEEIVSKSAVNTEESCDSLIGDTNPDTPEDVDTDADPSEDVEEDTKNDTPISED